MITQCSLNAAKAGVRVGQPLAEARSLWPHCQFLPADFALDRSALGELAIDSQQFTPLVGVEEGPCPESLLMEVTGCVHLWGGEEPFVRAVKRYWRSRGYRALVALAGSIGTSWALAHATPGLLVTPGGEEKAVSGLPVSVLRLPNDVLDRLHALGLETIGEVLCLPRESLTSRFGPLLPQRLDQALGRLPETFVCERLKEPLMALREWEDPVDDRFALDLVSRQLLAELVSKAGHLGMGLHEVRGELKTENGSVTIEIKLVEPTRDVDHLMKLAALQWERLAWPGGVISARWSALRLGQTDETQGFWPGNELVSKGSREFNALVERLGSRLGESSVLRADVVPDPQPEHAFRLVPWSNPQRTPESAFALALEVSRSRPLRLFLPQPIDVTSTVPDGPPIRIAWQGRTQQVVRSWGPERVATGWWRDEDVERDYYRVEWSDGAHAWVYRDQRTGRWFLHGFFE